MSNEKEAKPAATSAADQAFVGFGAGASSRRSVSAKVGDKPTPPPPPTQTEE